MLAVSKGGFGGEEVHKNSPFVSTYIISFLSLFSIFSATLFCADVVLRDIIHKMDSIIYATSMTRVSYFTIRFVGLLMAVFAHLCFAALGLFIGTIFIENANLGEVNISFYLYPLVVFGLPNVLLSVAVVFCVAIVTKNVRAIYAAGVLLYIIYMVASILGNSPLFATSTLKVNDSGIWPFLFDPYGMTSFFVETKKWTDEIKNSQLFPLNGIFLANRLMWLGVSAILVFLSYKLFNFRLVAPRLSKQKKDEQRNNQTRLPLKHFNIDPKGVRYNFYAFRSQFKLELISLFKHIPFMVMLLLWVFVFAVELKDTLFNGAYGIKAYPTTAFILEEIRSMNFGLILIIFFAAELVTREKSSKIDALIYSTPVQMGVLWGAKCLTLGVLVMGLVSLNICIGIGVQMANAYYHFELLKYLSLYYYGAFPLLLFVVLIVFIQNLTANKFLGMLLSMIVVLFFILAPQFGIVHFMLRFAAVPALQYSYFNGFGHYTEAFNWYMLYWLGFAIIIGLLTVGMWQVNRLRAITTAVRKNWLLGVLGLIVWIASGVFIYHRTNVIGNYRTKEVKLNWQISYEKRFAPLAHLPQPVVKSVKTSVDLLINESAYTVNGTYRLKNETDQVISKIWVKLDQAVNFFEINIPNSKKQEQDKVFNQQFITLNEPLLPNDEITMSFKLKVVRDGFVSFNTENSVSSNGTYIELEKYVPHFGFDEGLLTEDKIVRKAAGLPAVAPKEKPNYQYQLIDFETTISTNLDQQVVTVGALQRTWVGGQRRYFTYKTTVPINFMFALSSARYAIKKENHHGLAISIYYKKGQEYNLDIIMKAIKDAMDYCTSNFGTYAQSQIVLAEIPQYRGAATSYPGVVFSAEKLNFLSDYTNPDQVNQAYAITAHEVAHQWWANKLDPANVAGRAMLTESLAKYTEAMLIEKRFGKMYLSNYLQLDNHIYFVNRNPGEKEQPLTKVVDQGYVYYQKGGINTYAVKDAIGEQTFNKVLNSFVTNHQYPNRKASTDDFIKLLDKVTPNEQKKFVNQSFNDIITYEISLELLSCRRMADGKYESNLNIHIGLNKQGANGLTRPDMDVTIGLFDKVKPNWNAATKPFFVKKYRISDFDTKLSILTATKPKIAAIDPYHILLDADLTDNFQEIGN